MENFLSNFANTNAEVKASNASIEANAEFFGQIDITKGLLKMTIDFYARLHSMKYENCVGVDDWDINDHQQVSFNGVPIDDIDKLKNTLVNSGLKTVADGLTIDNKEFKRVIMEQIKQSEKFKNIFGEKAIIFSMLSNEEQSKVELKYAIDNYEKMTTNSHEMRKYLIVSESSTEMPTLEQLKEVYGN